MGVQIPGASFIPPNAEMRQAMTIQTTKRLLAITNQHDDFTPISHFIDEKVIVNGIVGLMATGVSTNLSIHMSAIAASAGIKINWDDFADISACVPLICKIYPNAITDL